MYSGILSNILSGMCLALRVPRLGAMSHELLTRDYFTSWPPDSGGRRDGKGMERKGGQGKGREGKGRGGEGRGGNGMEWNGMNKCMNERMNGRNEWKE